MACMLLTGAAGFIGSNLVDRLLAEGHQVIGFDNFSTGRREFLANALKNPAFTLVEGDLLNRARLVEALRLAPVNMVYHLAANADVSRGIEQPRKDLEQNTIATFNVLDAMREVGVGELAFSSTGSIYGEPEIVPTPENAPFPTQTSLYGASKLAGEGLIQAFAVGFGFTTWIFRFVSVLGERYTHGHIYDFYRKLQHDPTRLEVLGDGYQAKSYMYVQDCIDAMLLATAKASGPVNIFNLGLDGTIRVRDSIDLIIERLGLKPQLVFGESKRGWIGDSPLIHLDTAKIRALGWSPCVTIPAGIVKTLDWLLDNQWVYEH
jgi:UDP-glucose 4-epimerase